MSLICPENYCKSKLNDFLDLKCDKCLKLYKKTKKSWYYSAYDKKNKILKFDTKTYCSRNCLNSRYGNNKSIYNCLNCNNNFEGKIIENPKFCGHSCSAIFNNKKRNGNKLVKCASCDVEFKVWKCLNQKYFRCESCKTERKLQIENKKQKNINKTSKCKVCLTSFNYIKNKRIYCSKECIKKNKIKYKHVCVGCNFKFNSEDKRSKYCSHSCRSINLNLCQYAHIAGGKSRSKIEIFIENKLKKDYPNIKFEFNNKDAIGSELDIYIPELKIAFELNGIVHYKPIYGEQKLIKIQKKDKEKIIKCNELNIELFIFSLGNKALSENESIELYQNICMNINNTKMGYLGNDPSHANATSFTEKPVSLTVY